MDNAQSSQPERQIASEINGDCAQEMEDVAPPALGAMGSLFGDIYNSIDSGTRTNNGIQERQNYMTEPSLPADSNTLHWWRDTGCKKYPLLSTLTRKYLSVPGTSVRSERVLHGSFVLSDGLRVMSQNPVRLMEVHYNAVLSHPISRFFLIN
ncbi:hypothetical protein N1851_029115 [Merluccius polli]|uniref:HAT C-terminal dimerisation domain-containing protein n=1 Tax=Merluccius polli TaxID=89951 RepID=A0AA47NQZ1_MERPO|nr:hypothetical protein N1851_029115 [Merluccius polli]